MKSKCLAALLIAAIYSFAGSKADAQDFAVKSNLLYGVSATANLGFEIGLAPKWTAELTGNINAWDIQDPKRWRHLSVQPEARYWFCDRFAGHFLGIHALGGIYNVGNIKNGVKFLGTDFSRLTDSRFQGYFAGAGIAYGYAWILGRHWNIEAEFGMGYTYTSYDRFNCIGCGKKVEENVPHHYVGPTKAAINLVYLF